MTPKINKKLSEPHVFKIRYYWCLAHIVLGAYISTVNYLNNFITNLYENFFLVNLWFIDLIDIFMNYFYDKGIKVYQGLYDFLLLN